MTKKTKRHRLQFFIDKDLYAALEDKCLHDGRNVSAQLRILIHNYVYGETEKTFWQRLDGDCKRALTLGLAKIIQDTQSATPQQKQALAESATDLYKKFSA